MMFDKPKPLREHVYASDDIQAHLSVCCVTFNHAAYIKKALDGILMQETTFPVEILIHDDASTDGTADIIRSYQSKYPSLFKAILQTKNQFSQGIKPGISLRSKAEGDYLAFCEGDDYWTDKNKLEKQVSYMREHPEVVLTFHDVMQVDKAGNTLSESKIKSVMGKDQPAKLNNFELIAQSLIPTVSAVFRTVPVVIGPRGRRVVNGDTYLFAMLARFGNMHDMCECMAAHRDHEGGVWSSIPVGARAKVQLHTSEAIAYEIDPANALVASYNLANLSWLSFRTGLLRKEVVFCLHCARYYLVSIRCSFRCLHGGAQPFHAMLRNLAKIFMLPLLSLRSLLCVRARVDSDATRD